MGNFSQDPQTRASDALTKHYVGVRQQQGVPMVDADWNLLEDLRRSEMETVGSFFIGSGVPAGSDGFNISAAVQANDFNISPGLIMVSGKLTRNDNAVRYTTQPLFGKPIDTPLPALATPAADKQFLVYLDVWEREVDSQEDSGLVDARIGVETAIRLKREWAVRVARMPEDVPGLSAPPAGHVFLVLAQLNRHAVANITSDMIQDLRNTQLSVLRKVEVRDNTGTVRVDEARFSNMMLNTRKQYLNFVHYISTTFNPPFSPLSSSEVLGLQAGHNVAQAADAALAQANALTLANQGALAVLRQIYDAQEFFLTIWQTHVLLLGSPTKKYASYQALFNRLDDRLNKQNVPATLLTGLKPALDAGDLISAADTQEEIIRLIGTGANTVTRGSIQLAYSNAPPGNLTTGNVAQFQFTLTSATTQADSYTVTILPAAGWPRVLVDGGGNPIPGNKVALGASGAQTTLFVNVTPQAGTSGLQLHVESDSNAAEVFQDSTLLTLTQGQPPPPPQNQIQFGIESPFQATFNAQTGVLTVFRPPKPQPGSVGIRIFNKSGQNLTNIALAVDIVPGTAVGTWNAVSSCPPTINLNAGQDTKPGGINITASADSASVQVRFTASVTINGANVVSQLVIPVVASN